MDDYKTFQGRANLEVLKERRDNEEWALSEEDETLLMIFKLSGLDLDELIKQGESKNQDVIHDRQVDLQDSAMTLDERRSRTLGPERVPGGVSGRWSGVLHRD